MSRHLFLIVLLFTPELAAAQTTAELRRYAQSETRRGRCELTHFQVIHQGTLLQEPRFVSVIWVGTEGCGGSNSSESSVQVLVNQAGRLRPLPFALGANHPGQVTGVRMQDSNIIVEGMSLSPDDPRCCPTLKRAQTYVVMDGRVSPSTAR